MNQSVLLHSIQPPITEEEIHMEEKLIDSVLQNCTKSSESTIPNLPIKRSSELVT